jgi:hypothetical protein
MDHDNTFGQLLPLALPTGCSEESRKSISELVALQSALAAESPAEVLMFGAP